MERVGVDERGYGRERRGRRRLYLMKNRWRREPR